MPLYEKDLKQSTSNKCALLKLSISLRGAFIFPVSACFQLYLQMTNTHVKCEAAGSLNAMYWQTYIFKKEAGMAGI